MLHKEITEVIIGAAMAVLNELKPGLVEKLCEKAPEKCRRCGFKIISALSV
jgi:lipopolysaccharide biosynthesis regulator YciM